MKKTLLGFAFFAFPAFSHVSGQPHSFVEGLMHPMVGLDHALILLSLGYLTLVQSQKSWVLPLGFGLSLASGFAISLLWGGFTLMELGVLASIFGMAAVIGFSDRLSFVAKIGAIVPIGLLHGAVHGAESQGWDNGFFGLGIILASAGLLAFGYGLGNYFKNPRARSWVAGSLAFSGMALAFSAF